MDAQRAREAGTSEPCELRCQHDIWQGTHSRSGQCEVEKVRKKGSSIGGQFHQPPMLPLMVNRYLEGRITEHAQWLDCLSGETIQTDQ